MEPVIVLLKLFFWKRY